MWQYIISIFAVLFSFKKLDMVQNKNAGDKID